MTKPKGRHPGGRPIKYKPEFARQAKALCSLGATDRELCAFFDVSEPTLNSWKTQYKLFFKSLKLGKANPDERVRRSLYQRATGYHHDAVKIMLVKRVRRIKSPEGKYSSVLVDEIVHEPYIEHYPPDSTAAIFWLKNRDPKNWRDAHKHEHSTPPGKPMEVRTYAATESQLLADYYAKLDQAASTDPAIAEDLGRARRPGPESDGDQDPGEDGSLLPPR